MQKQVVNKKTNRTNNNKNPTNERLRWYGRKKHMQKRVGEYEQKMVYYIEDSIATIKYVIRWCFICSWLF